MLHPLTEKVWCDGPKETEQVDRIITDYLREKANEIADTAPTDKKEYYRYHSKRILGLTEEPKTMKKDYDLDDHCPQTGDMVKTPVSGEWPCEHKQYDNILYKFCPICGTPRPKQIGLREKLVKAIIHEGFGLIDSEQVADAVIRTIKEHEGE